MTFRSQYLVAGLSLLAGLVWGSVALAAQDSLTVRQDPIVNRAVLDDVTVALKKLDLATLKKAPIVEQGAGIKLQAKSDSAGANEQVTVLIDQKVQGQPVQADSTGFWFVYLDTLTLKAGMHRIEYQTATKLRTQLLDFEIIETAPSPEASQTTASGAQSIGIGGFPVWYLWLLLVIAAGIGAVAYSLYKKHKS